MSIVNYYNKFKLPELQQQYNHNSEKNVKHLSMFLNVFIKLKTPKSIVVQIIVLIDNPQLGVICIC